MKSKQLISIIGGVAVLVIIIVAVVAATSSKKDTSSMSGMTMGSQTSSSQGGGSSSAAVATDMVTIQNFAFSPAHITVKVGTTVTWTNKDVVQHNVMSDDGNMPNGPLLAEGKTYSYTFTKAGTYNYHCMPHPYMKATITVTN